MRRWVWKVLLTAAAVLALAGTALAADPVTATLDNGVVLTQDGTGWKITGYTGSGGRVVLPSEYDKKTVASVGDAAFKSTAGRKVSEVVFPNTITSIGDNAFENCAGLKTVLFLPDSTGDVTIGKSAFSGTGISMLVLPDQLTSIGESAFANNINLTKVTIPDSVTAIGSKAFANDRGLKTVYIPAALKPATSGGTKPVSADAFANTTLESIHYGGTDKADILYEIFAAMPPGLWRDQVHLATDSTHINPPTCEENGLVMGGGFCREASDKQTEACKDLAGDEITIPALGHDYQRPLDAFNSEAAKHADCSTWEWTYEAPCPRCGLKVTGTEKILPKEGAEHTWVDDNAEGEVTTAPTCTAKGVKTFQQTCTPADGKKCGATRTRTTEMDALGHTFAEDRETTEVTVKEATCAEPGIKGWRRTCQNEGCGITEPCPICDDPNTTKEALLEHWESFLPTPPGPTPDPTPVPGTRGADPDADPPPPHWVEEYTLDADDLKSHPQDRLTETGTAFTAADGGPYDCTQGGKKTTTYKCELCGKEGLTAVEDEPKKDQHKPDHAEEVTPADCTHPMQIRIPEGTKCTVCQKEIEAEVREDGEPLGHKWGDFTPDAGQSAEPNENCAAKDVTGTVACTRGSCGASEKRTLTIPGKGRHTWGEWVTVTNPSESGPGSKERVCSVCGEKETASISTCLNHTYGDWEITKPATETTPGSRQRICSVCGHTDTEEIPATGGSGGDNPTTPPETTRYSIDLIQASNGSVSAPSTAAAGTRVVLDLWADSGYELDQLRVTNVSSGSIVSCTSLGGGQYRFTMPASRVEVRVSFVRKYSGSSSGWSGSSSSSSSQTTDPSLIQGPVQPVPRAGASSQLFRDIPTSHWAAGEINWANQMGYMNGTAGRFNPDGNITFQQLWMVLARLTGSRPANMAEARRWAVNSGFAEGASPTGLVTRHQLVTALYRSAHLMGSTNRNTTSLAGYADSRTVPASARDAFAWAVANGIIGGTGNGRLAPNATLTRAQFAVILYRFSQRI